MGWSDCQGGRLTTTGLGNSSTHNQSPTASPPEHNQSVMRMVMMVVAKILIAEYYIGDKSIYENNVQQGVAKCGFGFKRNNVVIRIVVTKYAACF